MLLALPLPQLLPTQTAWLPSPRHPTPPPQRVPTGQAAAASVNTLTMLIYHPPGGHLPINPTERSQPWLLHFRRE